MLTHIPHHVAIIPDGNRRWAKKEAIGKKLGYVTGAEALITIVKAAKELGVKIVTFFLFSTENWFRPQEEVDLLMDLFEQYIRKTAQEMHENRVRLTCIGKKWELPTELQRAITEVEEYTQSGNALELILALNYGGKDELCRAMNTLIADMQATKIAPPITEKTITSYLDTQLRPDPDLVIRTSGEQRMSNFLLWQSAYAEFYIEEEPWPNFTPKHLLNALLDFQKRERRQGAG